MSFFEKSKAIAHQLLGDEQYLSLLSKGFLALHNGGFLKNKHPELYFNQNFVKAGNTCIDIGANLGYYTIPLAQWVGPKGKVYAVEPVPVFQKVLQKNIQSHQLSLITELVPFALGPNNNAIIEMGTPAVAGVMHHGYTKVLQPGEKQDLPIVKTYQVAMKHPEELFKNLNALHYLKCDIEGFEINVMPLFYEIIERFLPVMQIEICDQNHRIELTNLFGKLGYEAFFLKNNALIPIEKASVIKPLTCDVFFLPQKAQAFKHLISYQN